MKSHILLVALLALTACAGAEITTPPVMIVPKVPANAVGVDVYAKDRARGNPVPRFRGQKTVQVRTRGKGESSSHTELSGVPCTMDSGLYSASFVTPANIVVPDYGPNSPALFVRCVVAERSGSATVTAINMTAQQRQSSAAGTGLLGAIIIGAVAAAHNNPEKDDFAYPAINVSLR